MIRKLIITVSLFAVCASSVRAQFTIPTVDESARLENKPMVDTTMVKPMIDNPYFSRGRWLAERRALRKERNTIEFNAALAASQTQFKDWQAGGENTFSSRSVIFFHHLHKRDRFSIDYRLDGRYGANYIDKKLFKNEDEWKTNVQTAWTLHRSWSYAATANVRSQFSRGRKSRTDATVISDFMAPGFLDLSVGFNWKKEGSPWNITISPVTGSVVLVLDKHLQSLGINGVPAGKSTKGQLGPSLRIFYDKEFAKKVFRYRSDLYSFTNLRNSPTVRWENTLEIMATKLFSTKVYWLCYYDRPAIDRVQYNYSLSVGISYWIKNK